MRLPDDATVRSMNSLSFCSYVRKSGLHLTDCRSIAHLEASGVKLVLMCQLWAGRMTWFSTKESLIDREGIMTFGCNYNVGAQ